MHLIGLVLMVWAATTVCHLEAARRRPASAYRRLGRSRFPAEWRN